MKEYTKSGKIHPCRLRRNDLLKFIGVVKETFPASDRKEDFVVYSNLPNISIRENNIEDFLKHEELPDKLNRLSVYIIGWSEDRGIYKRVEMTFCEYFIDLHVNGVDQTWVLGKYSRLTDFLKDKKPWFWPIYMLTPSGIGFILVIVPVVLFTTLVHFIKAKEIVYSTSAAFLFIAWIYATALYFRGAFLPYTQIILSDKKPFFTRENVAIIVALLSLIVSIIGVVKSFFK